MTHAARRQTPRAAARGLGLIELLISMGLGLLVVLAVSAVFISSRQASRSTDSLGRMQETLRNSFELMARDLREAGGNPCDHGLPVMNVLNNAQSATPTWWANWGEQLRGFEGADAFDGAAIGTGTGQRVTGTDAVTVKFAADLGDLTVATHNPTTATFTVNNNPHRVNADDLLLVCDYRQGAVLQASGVTATTILHAESAATAGNCSRGLGIPTDCSPAGTAFNFNPGAKIGRLVAVGWYVGNNGRPATGGRSLYRVTRDGTEEVAEGIEDLQLQYLTSTGTDYVDAAPGTNWAPPDPASALPVVVGVRITLSLRSAETGVSTNASGRLQRTLAFTLSMRNRMP